MLRSYMWLMFCVVVWGSNFVFGKMLVQSFSPALLTSLRLLFIVLLLIGISSFKNHFKRLTKKDFFFIVLLGIIGVWINQWSFFVALETADPTTSALILATTPILTGIFAAVFLKEKVTVRMVMGSLIAIIGIYFVVTKGNTASFQIDKGLFWIVVTMITFAIMIIMTKLLSTRVDPLTITYYSNVVGFAVSIPFVFVLDHPIRMTSDIGEWASLIGTAVVVHGIATLIWNHNIRFVDASKASILSNLEPFVAMITGLILLYKPITGAEILGSFFIVGGVVLSTINAKKRERKHLIIKEGEQQI